MRLKEAFQIVIDLAVENEVSEYGEGFDPSGREDQQKAFKVLREFMNDYLTSKQKKPVPFFLTPSMEAVLNVLLTEPRKPLAKHEISKLCDPRMNDHAVSARISDLRQRGFEIKKDKAKGETFFRYFIPRS